MVEFHRLGEEFPWLHGREVLAQLEVQGAVIERALLVLRSWLGAKMWGTYPNKFGLLSKGTLLVQMKHNQKQKSSKTIFIAQQMRRTHR